ncbi:hypothetical protein FB451DRAFT_1174149 [Mycena latifolia]|nr:hypothetical protein FB451DRAFT_1174149 [Mycena latifolia]
MITDLAIVPGQDGLCPNFGKSPTRQIHLPKLQRFVGPAISARDFIPGSPASHATIWWKEILIPKVAFSFSQGLEAIAQSNVRNLNNLITSWDQTLLVAVVDHLPHLQYLRITNVKHIRVPGANVIRNEEHAHGPSVLFLAIDDALNSLTCLDTLTIACVPVGDNRAVIDDDELDADFHAVRRWGEISPTLSRISFPSSGTLWIRVQDIWCPTSGRGVQWLIKKVRTSPSEMPAGYHKIAGSFVGTVASGPDEMTALPVPVKLPKEVMEVLLQQASPAMFIIRSVGLF